MIDIATTVSSALPLPTRLEPEPRQCPQHGEFMASGWLIAGRTERRQPCPACERERAEAEARAAAEAEARARAQRWADLIGQAAIPPRFRDRTLASFRAETAEQQRALDVCREYAEGFADHLRTGSGLLLVGNPGTGKTHLACAILAAVLDSHPAVQYTTAPDLIRSVRDTWRRDSERTETQLLGHLRRLHLLVIDEVGVAYGTPAEQHTLFDVIDGRYRNARPTILVSNLSTADLRASVGDRIYDRLTECARGVSFGWASYRPQARREAA